MYREDLVDRIRSLIARQEKIVEDYEQDHNQALTRAIRFAEVSRIKFCLRSYLRKRLSKIEAYAIHIYMNEELSSKLSPQVSGSDTSVDSFLSASGGCTARWTAQERERERERERETCCVVLCFARACGGGPSNVLTIDRSPPFARAFTRSSSSQRTTSTP